MYDLKRKKTETGDDKTDRPGYPIINTPCS